MRENNSACPAKTAPTIKLIAPALLTLALIASPFAHSQKSTLVKPLALTHVTVIDGVSAEPKPDYAVVIIDGRIAEIGPDKQVRIPKDAQVVNARGKFLIPGLWDMHAHFGEAGESLLPALLANGVTSVREMGGDGELALRLREQVKSGSLLGPRIKCAGQILESPRFIQLVERLSGESLAGKRVGIANAGDARRAIEAAAQSGADFLKIRTNASRASYLAIAAEARRVGLPLVGHAPVGVSLLDVADAGHRSIEHGMLLTNSLSPDELKEIAARFVKNGTHVTPTLIAGRGFREMPDDEVLAIIDDKAGTRDARRKYVPQSLADNWRRQIEMKKEETRMDWGAIRERNLNAFRALHQGGVKMMAGTDLGGPLVYPGFSLHEELELMVKKIGLTPAQALQSATRIPAEFMGMQDSLGTIEKGKIADLVLLTANPLGDITNTRKIAAVVIGGKLIDQAGLRAMLEKTAADAGNR